MVGKTAGDLAQIKAVAPKYTVFFTATHLGVKSYKTASPQIFLAETVKGISLHLNPFSILCDEYLFNLLCNEEN